MYELEMNVGPFREFQSVCLQQSSKCTVEGLVPNTKYLMRARVREPWGISAWSFPTAGQTLSTTPDAPSPIQVQWLNDQQVELTWKPPKNNGGALIAFQVFGARVPNVVRKYTKQAVTTYTPTEPFRAGPTDGLPNYIMSKALPVEDYPSAHHGMMLDFADEEDDDIWYDEDKDDQDWATTRTVIEPNLLSPEAVATVKSLPEPDLPGYLAEDMEARKVFVAQELADDEIGADFTEEFLTDLGNVTTLTYTWDVPVKHSPGLYVVRVRALNKYGMGKMSPIYRFYASTGSAAMPPDEPQPVELSRATETSMQITWQQPRENGAVVNQYVLRALGGKDIDPKRVELDPKLFQDIYVGSSRSHTLNRLVPGSWYYFYLFARNAVGQSPPSGIKLFRVPGNPESIGTRYNSTNVTQVIDAMKREDEGGVYDMATSRL